MNFLAPSQPWPPRRQTLGTITSPGAEGARPALAWAIPAGAAHDVPSISCVVPCRNEASNLDALLTRLMAVLSECTQHWEVIIVDDGSTDATLTTLMPWTASPGVRVVQLSRNFGKEAALTAGLRAACGDLIVMMDADLQHEPELLPDMLAKWREGADMVYAIRAHRNDEGTLKRMGARLFYAMLNATDRIEVPADAGDFRLMTRHVVDTLLALPERNRFMKGLYAWVGFKTAALPYTPAPRGSGHSQFSLWRLVRLSLDGLTAFTTWPLRAVSLTGFILAGLAFLYGGYLTVAYLAFGHSVSGWTTIVVSLMLFAGIQMVSLGVVGEYVGRIFEEVKGRPLYVVQHEFGQGFKTRSHP